MKELSRWQKLHFVLKEYMDGYFWLGLEKHFLPDFFQCHFSLGQRENTSSKIPADKQAMKIQIKSGEIQVHKNVEKIMKNVVDMLANTQNSIIVNKGNHLMPPETTQEIAKTTYNHPANNWYYLY